jgi:aminocarboxymuconate-semialdehyde decarboxylase
MLIDMHAHVVPESFPAGAGRASADRWPSMDHFEPGRARVMINGENFRTVHDGNWNLERRLRDMEAFGVDAEAISPMPELLSYWFTPQDGIDFSRYMNEFIVKLCEGAPGRFFGLGIVPLQDPDLATRELDNIKKMGLTGIELGSNILGKSLGEDRFLGFFQEAARLGIPIFVHALHPTFADRIPAPVINSVGFPTDTGLTIGSMIASGTAEKCPELRIAFSHAGGSFPFILPRYQHGWGGTWNEEPSESGGRDRTLPHSPAEYARRFYYDTLIFHHKAIRYLVDMIGHTQLLAGTDYPFMQREKPVGKTLYEMTDLSRAVVEDITWNNCFRFLGVPAPVVA